MGCWRLELGEGAFGRGESWRGEERAEEEPDDVSGGWLEVRFAVMANLYVWVGDIWKGNVLVALFINRVGVCDGQEICIEVERNILRDDEGGFSVVDINRRFQGSEHCTDLTVWRLDTLEHPRHQCSTRRPVR